MKLIFEYDPDKSRRNKAKHGIDLMEAQELWGVPHLIFPAREAQGESRHVIIGQMRGRIHLAIFTHRGIAIRLVSCHVADARWERAFQGGHS